MTPAASTLTPEERNSAEFRRGFKFGVECQRAGTTPFICGGEGGLRVYLAGYYTGRASVRGELQGQADPEAGL
jgi:hypothetical protein